jgi:iron complex outermembrane receptor protein
MLKLVLSLASIALPLISFSQFSLSGIVRDSKNNQPLPGAVARIDETKSGTSTDEFGHFQIHNLKSGEYTLRVSLLGYAEKILKTSVSQNETIEVSLDETSIITDAVVITATRATDKTPTTYTTLTKDKIQRQNFGQDLPFLLNWTPSVVTTSDAGNGIGYTGIRIRGSDATRVNVTINGVPYNDSESLGTFWVDIPDIASSSQSIQIQRGVGTSTNGAGAFGASINVQTNQRRDDPYLDVINSVGSFNSRRHTLNFGTGLLNDHWVFDGRLSKISSDGFIDRASSALQSYYFSGGFYTKKSLLKFVMFGGKERTYQAWYGVPQSRLNNDTEAMMTTALNEYWNDAQTNNLMNSNSRTFNPYTYQNQVDDYKQDHYQLHFSHQFSSVVNLNTAVHFTPGKGYYEEYRYNDSFSKYGIAPVTIGDSTITSADLIRRRWLNNKFYGITYSLNIDKNDWNIIIGGAWNRYDGDHYGQVVWSQVSPVPTEYQYYFNNGDKRDFNSYIKANYQISETLNGFVDLQYRKLVYTAGGVENKLNTFTIDKNYNFFNPKFGLTYAPSAQSQFYSSFAIGNHEPVRDDFVDNPGKTPSHETLRNIEIGYRGKGTRHVLNVNYYLMDYKNQLVLTGKLNDVGASVRTNVPKSYRTGIEIDGLFKISRRLQWNANLTFSKNKIQNFTEVLYDYGANFDEYNVVEKKYSNTDISFSPNIIAGSGLSFFPFRNAELTLLSKYVGKQYLDNTSNNQRSIKAYFINDVRLGYSIKPGLMKEINFSLLINNIFNKKYQSNGYTWGYLAGPDAYRENYYYPQAGTNVLAMITMKF